MSAETTTEVPETTAADMKLEVVLPVTDADRATTRLPGRVNIDVATPAELLRDTAHHDRFAVWFPDEAARGRRHR
jgi:hypothetical protein